MHYEVFEKLCKINGVRPGTISKATGISTATLTSWKQGKYTPKQDKMQLIADYFCVSVPFLLGDSDSVYCDKCETYYNPLDRDSLLKHEYIHKAYEDALEKYGEYNYIDAAECACNDVLSHSLFSGSIFNDPDYDSDVFQIYDNYLKTCFSRLLRRNNFVVKYDDFEEFAREQILKDIDEHFMTTKLFDRLSSKYDIKLPISNNDEKKYYLDEETAKMAQSIFKNKDLRMLFDAAQDAKPEDLQTVHTMLLALKRKERGDID